MDVKVNGHWVALRHSRDRGNVRRVLQIDPELTLFVSVKGRDYWSLLCSVEFEDSREYDVITTPISQPLKTLTVDRFQTGEEWEDVIEALPCFQEVTFAQTSLEDGQSYEQLSTAMKLSSRLKRLRIQFCDGPFVLKICEGLGGFGTLESIHISDTRDGVGDALCEILGQYIESSRFIPSITLLFNGIGDDGCVSLLKGIKGRSGRSYIDGALLDIDLRFNRIGVPGLLAILEFFDAGYSAHFTVQDNKMPLYHGEQNLKDLTSQYEELGWLRCSLGEGPEEESVINRYVGHELNVKCRLMSDPINTDDLKELAHGSFGTVFQLGDNEVVKVTSPVPQESTKRYLRELKLWAMMTGNSFVELESMGRKEEGGMVKFMYVMRRYDGDLTQYLQREGRLKLSKCVIILRSISHGLHLLHDKFGIIHRDLHSGNVLCAEDRDFKISDLGLSVLECDLVSCGEEELLYFNTMGSSSVFAEHIRPPELMSGDMEKIGYPTDIYAFGILMFQVLTGKDITTCSKSIPEEIKHFADIEYFLQVDEEVDMDFDEFFLFPLDKFRDEVCYGYMKQRIKRCQVLLVDVMSRCLDRDPNKRPTALQLWFCFHICAHLVHFEFVENLRWDEMRNLHSSSTRVGTVFISKKKGSSWFLTARADQIGDMVLRADKNPTLTIFTDSGCCLPAEGLLMTGWDSCGQYTTTPKS
eukprot:TRINITY_DN801_c0_g1_i3.p1 TRINITY_DN801_c0_g1~~TRINITY_DN801_c0_g1_i3.p1  ORF type:complete len:711 (+),score=126.53 TRINITY_DN801_c0_g1_i3:44-2134(+)